MLSILKVDNLAVVESAELRFSPHLNVLTGETGAGKSLLIDALMLLLQKRIPPGILRTGAANVRIEALFDAGDDEWVLRREVDESNRSLCWINNAASPFMQLRERAAALLNIYGQRDHLFLLQTGNHVAFLDSFAATGELVAELGQIYKRIQQKVKERDALQNKSREAEERLDFLQFQIHEIESLALSAEDEKQLEERHKILAAAEEIASHGQELCGDLMQNETSVYQLLAKNRANIAFLNELFPDFAPFAEELERMNAQIPEIEAFVTIQLGRIDYSQEEFDTISSTLQKVGRLKAKYKLNYAQILARLDDMRAEYSLLANAAFHLHDKEKEIALALAEYSAVHAKLRAQRQNEALKLGAIIVAELGLLEMKKARFEVHFEDVQPALDTIAEKGCDHIEFYFSSNPGQEPGPLSEVASGGELSRLMLVLKSLNRDGGSATYIFDEIDAGIGGKTAEFVGAKLQQIAAANQVICISHLPQIASLADCHILINKEFSDTQTFSLARVLKDEERVGEIARLMAGSTISADVLRAAKSLLKKRRA